MKNALTRNFACFASIASLSLSWLPLNPVCAQEAGQNAAAVGVVPTKLLAGQAKMDETVTPKISPFNLGISAEGEAEDEAPLRGAASGKGAFSGISRQGLLDNSANRLPSGLNNTTFKLKAEDARVLSRYNLRLIVDRSNSMHTTDCPDGLSRWEWCGLQATGLAEAVNPLASKGLTIATFATQYDVFENASPANIQYLFQNLQLQNGTRLFEPLAEQADTYFADRTPGKKPLLIVVVTDGVPVPKIEPIHVRQELVNISNRVKSPGEATVIFCQVGGNDRMGRAYLQDLDQNLQSYGARYNLVHTVSFEDLQQQGLGGALAAAVQKYAPVIPEPVAAKPAGHAASPPRAAMRTTVHLARAAKGGVK